MLKKLQQHSSHQLLPTPDGITAFCHLIASWFQVDLVLALTVNEAGDRAQIITTSSATPFRQSSCGVRGETSCRLLLWI